MAQPVKPSDELVRETLEFIRRNQPAATRTRSECIASVGTPECRERLTAYLESEPFPRFKPHAIQQNLLERIEDDGSRQFGRFEGRKRVLEA